MSGHLLTFTAKSKVAKCVVCKVWQCLKKFFKFYQTKILFSRVHELSIAQSIIEIAEDVAFKNNSHRIKKIKVQIGEFSGIVKEALEFSFEIAKVGTKADGAELEIEIVGFKAICKNCGFVLDSMDDFNLFCPKCAEPMEIISGREMRVEYIEIE